MLSGSRRARGAAACRNFASQPPPPGPRSCPGFGQGSGVLRIWGEGRERSKGGGGRLRFTAREVEALAAGAAQLEGVAAANPVVLGHS